MLALVILRNSEEILTGEEECRRWRRHRREMVRVYGSGLGDEDLPRRFPGMKESAGGNNVRLYVRSGACLEGGVPIRG